MVFVVFSLLVLMGVLPLQVWAETKSDQVSEWIRRLEDPYAIVEACGALGSMGSEAEPAVPALMSVIREEKEGISHANSFEVVTLDTEVPAVAALGRIGPSAAEALPLLWDRLDKIHTEPGYLRSTYAQAIARIGPVDPEAAVRLVEIARDLNQTYGSDAQQIAAQSFARAPSLPPEVIPGLVRAFQENSNVETEASFADALGKAGPAAKGAVPKLLALYEQHGWFSQREKFRAAARKIQGE